HRRLALRGDRAAAGHPGEPAGHPGRAGAAGRGHAAGPGHRAGPRRVAFGMRAPLGGILVSLCFIGVVAISLSAISYTVGLVTKSEDVLAPAINMVVVPLMLLSGIMLPMALGPGWLQGIARATPFRYIIDAMRNAFSGHYLNAVMLEGIAVAIGLAAVCMWVAARTFVRENA